jgi:transcription antitermination factor NusG
MPILAAETSLFPEGLLDGPRDESPARSWWVLYTRARQEKAVARRLLSHEIPFYLPLVSKDHFTRGRCVRSHIPLFAGYVFLFGSEEERARALTTNRIFRTLRVVDQTEFCRDLRRVRQLIESGAPLTVEQRLMPGGRVRVKAGPMIGLEGRVISRRGACRLLVAVNFLQQGASVAIEDFMVEPLDDLNAA